MYLLHRVHVQYMAKLLASRMALGFTQQSTHARCVYSIVGSYHYHLPLPQGGEDIDNDAVVATCWQRCMLHVTYTCMYVCMC